MSVQAVSQWENGKSGVSVDSITSIAQIVGVDVGWLLNGPRASTMFLETAGEVSRVPVILAEDAMLVSGTAVLGAKFIPAFEVLTETVFRGSCFAIYNFDDAYGDEFAKGDLLIFDTEYDVVEGAVILATVMQFTKGKTEPTADSRSMRTSLFQMSASDEGKPISPTNLMLKPIGTAAPIDPRQRYFPAGRLVERRTYPAITAEQIANLKSHLTVE